MRRSRLSQLSKDVLIKIIETIEGEYLEKIRKLKQYADHEGICDEIFCMGEGCLDVRDSQCMDWDGFNDLAYDFTDYRCCENCTVEHQYRGRYLCEDCTEKYEEDYGEDVMLLYLYNYVNEGPTVVLRSRWECKECIKYYIDNGKYTHETIYAIECGHLVWEGYCDFILKSSDQTKEDVYPLIKLCDECKASNRK